jgi:hypothetical protein
MSIGFYRKKPVVISAVQFTGSNHDELRAFGAIVVVNGDNTIIGTLEDGPMGEVVHVATVGDYIIKGVHGEFYPCKPDIFKETYDACLPVYSSPEGNV